MVCSALSFPDYGHGIKDVILITLLFGATIGCYYAYHQNKSSKKHLQRMIKDMESLHKAELALDHLQVIFYNILMLTKKNIKCLC